ncbi:hypothetical protein ACFCWX_31235, partial [Streptomyces sp. NPDC056405]
MGACTWVVLLLTVLARGAPRPVTAAVPTTVATTAPVEVATTAVAVAVTDAGRIPDPAVPAVARLWPVGTRPAVLRGWEPPATPYGPGHRGVD